LPKLRRKPADLTNKERMAAMTDGELFWKITKGIQGIMPAGERRNAGRRRTMARGELHPHAGEEQTVATD
jgi:hypothetical protein